jgi:Cu-processing system permease protein
VSVLVVARWTVLEARRRRLLAAGVVLSVAFVALFAVGFALLYNNQQRSLMEAEALGTGVLAAREELLAMSTILVVLGLYGVQLLGALLGLFLGVASVSPEIDSGALHAVLARPLSRLQYLLGRFLALAGLLAAYVLVMSGALLLTMLALFGIAWLGGILGFVATFPPGNELLANLGTAAGLLLPADAVWRGASFHVLPPSFLAATSLAGGEVDGPPFVSTAPMAPAMLAWALAYPAACLALAVAAFRRRDL